MAQDKTAQPQSDSVLSEHAHEQRDVNYLIIALCLALIIVSAFVIHSSVWWWLVSVTGPKQGNGITTWSVLTPHLPLPARDVPVLDLNPQVHWRDFMERESKILSTYGWATPDHQFVRIPIDRAMQIIVTNGHLPEWNLPKSNYTISP